MLKYTWTIPFFHRSLALLLGLLSHKSFVSRSKKRTAGTGYTNSIEQVLLVPHTELARQFEYWLELLQATDERTSASQDVLPDAVQFSSSSDTDTTGKMTDIRPSHRLPSAQVAYRSKMKIEIHPTTELLISTPNAFLDILPTLDLSRLHTVALDEADSMLSLPNRFAPLQEVVKWQRHPPLIISLMEEILTPISIPTTSPAKATKGEKPQRQIFTDKRLVAVSATANSVFRDWLVRRSGWIGSKGILKGKQIDWYDFSGGEAETSADRLPGETEYQRIGKGMLPQDSIQHGLYTVDKMGGLVEANATLGNSGDSTLEDPERLSTAVATIFALEEIVSGLVLIPSGQSLKTTLATFRSLGVPATTLHESQDLAHDEPRLYVISIDAVKGLDIPNLSHVFVLPGLVNDSNLYLHVAGRVGRLSIGGKRKSGKVVCLVSHESDEERKRVERNWELLGITGHTKNVDHIDAGQVE